MLSTPLTLAGKEGPDPVFPLNGVNGFPEKLLWLEEDMDKLEGIWLACHNGLVIFTTSDKMFLASLTMFMPWQRAFSPSSSSWSNSSSKCSLSLVIGTNGGGLSASLPGLLEIILENLVHKLDKIGEKNLPIVKRLGRNLALTSGFDSFRVHANSITLLKPTVLAISSGG